MILALAIGHFGIGVLLGTRFRVIVLAPAAVASVLAVAAAAGIGNAGLGGSLLAAGAALAALQIGFLGGVFLRDRMTALRPPRPSPQGGHVIELPSRACSGTPNPRLSRSAGR